MAEGGDKYFVPFADHIDRWQCMILQYLDHDESVPSRIVNDKKDHDNCACVEGEKPTANGMHKTANPMFVSLPNQRLSGGW